MSSLFGGSKQESRSWNTNRDAINSAFSPVMGAANEGYNAISALLGGDSSGFNRFKDTAGYNFAAKEGSAGVLGNGAARGLLRSGATGKGLISFGQKLSDQYLDSYMQKLLGMSNLGLGAGSLVSDAGKESTQKSSSKPGLGGLVGSIASGIATGGLSTAIGGLGGMSGIGAGLSSLGSGFGR